MEFERSDSEDKIVWGLAFAGGGTKGAFEVGAAKALKELGLPVGAVAGTSIGSVNGAMFAADQVEELENMYDSIAPGDVLELPENSGFDPKKDLLSFGNALQLLGEMARQNGISNEPLRATVLRYLNTERLYASPVDFGICTFDRKKNSGLELFKEDIPKEKLSDFLLASACFPIFRPQDIDGTSFMDGGFYDNLPVNMLIRRGFRNIILVDVEGIGMMRRTLDRKVRIRVISPSEDLGGTFDFNHANIRKNIRLGYLDTMKAFRRLVGNYFYFEPEEFMQLLRHFTLSEIAGFEKAGKLYGLSRYEIRTAEIFLTLLKEHFEEELKRIRNLKEKPTPAALAALVQNGGGIGAAAEVLLDYPALYTEKPVLKLIGEYADAAHALLML